MLKRLLSLFRFLFGEKRIEPNLTSAVLAFETTLLSGGTIRTETMDLNLKDDAAAQAFAVVLKDKFGNVAEASGPLAVAVGDPELVSAELSTDGKTLTLAPAAKGKLGTTTVTVAESADSLSTVINVSVVAGAPATIELDAPQAAASEAAAPAEAAPSSTEPAAAPQAAPAA